MFIRRFAYQVTKIGPAAPSLHVVNTKCYLPLYDHPSRWTLSGQNFVMVIRRFCYQVTKIGLTAQSFLVVNTKGYLSWYTCSRSDSLHSYNFVQTVTYSVTPSFLLFLPLLLTCFNVSCCNCIISLNTGPNNLKFGVSILCYGLFNPITKVSNLRVGPPPWNYCARGTPPKTRYSGHQNSLLMHGRS